MVGIFVLSMLAMMVVPLCYSSTLIDRHHPDGHRVRIEINDGRTRNSTLTLTRGKPAGNADFPDVGNGGFFYSPPHPWGEKEKKERKKKEKKRKGHPYKSI
ncbi:hypothetical protein [Endozoicomonas sp. ALD040]|uniref:hypothetical protein n=1 Tax=Endozoicomonas sp. ALD040 TaxID=3403079 RepID=UPI003BAFFE47